MFLCVNVSSFADIKRFLFDFNAVSTNHISLSVRIIPCPLANTTRKTPAPVVPFTVACGVQQVELQLAFIHLLHTSTAEALTQHQTHSKK